MTHDQFDECIKLLCAGVGRKMEALQAVVWREALEHLDYAALKHGVSASLRDWTFGGFPPIGFVAERCGMPKATVSDDQRGVLAWDTVLHAMRSHGGYVSVNWDDPAIPAAIEAVAGSWAAMCEMESAELMRFVKPKFIEAWKAFRASGINRGTVSEGILARDAGRIGGEAPEPVRIGRDAPPVIGFGKGPVQALPAPDSPRRLTVAASLADRLTVPPDEAAEKFSREPPPVKEPVPLPSDAEWQARAAAQRRALEVKYGPIAAPTPQIVGDEPLRLLEDSAA